MRLDDVRSAVRDFAIAMEIKLREHDDTRGKDGWLKEEDTYILERLHEELEELDNAIHCGHRGLILNEAVDAANFLMMYYDLLTHDRPDVHTEQG